MPSCAFTRCSNYSRRRTKTHGVTYHSFPQDKFWRHKWLVILRQQRQEPDWIPSSYSRICSNHFKPEDIYKTRKGFKKILKGALPFFTDPMLYSDTDYLIADRFGSPDVEAIEEGCDDGRSDDSNTLSIRKRKCNPQPQSSKVRGTASKIADEVVMASIVEDNITDPSRPVKRRIDELLLMCRAMMREKDRQITVLKEQVEDLTKKNIRLRNTLIDITKKSIGENAEDLDIIKETGTWFEKQTSVELKKEKDIKIAEDSESEVEDVKPSIEQYDSKDIKIEEDSESEVEDVKPSIEQYDSKLINEDTIVIKTEIEIHEHDINDAANVTSGTEVKSDVYTSKIKKEIDTEKERRHVDTGIDETVVTYDRKPYDTIVSAKARNIRTHAEFPHQYKTFWEVSKQDNNISE